MIETVIEERAADGPQAVAAISARIGDSLGNIQAGYAEATKVRQPFIEEGLWSQYLEVGIGPDAEWFSKAQTLSSVGAKADVGLHSVPQYYSNAYREVSLRAGISSTGVQLFCRLRGRKEDQPLCRKRAVDLK
jgi:fumarylacetoacetate (FAA) hydrolase family protein